MESKPNLLDHYLRQKGERARSLARRTGLAESVVSRVRNGKATPTLTQAALIESATGIPASSWVTLHPTNLTISQNRDSSVNVEVTEPQGASR